MTGHTGPLLLFFRALPGASFKLTLSPCSGNAGRHRQERRRIRGRRTST
uniref:Uncharacterized protein n=1 Tax=Anguilla anguilla TaxID=7936 RepID=A0A0E9UV04_ANGAN